MNNGITTENLMNHLPGVLANDDTMHVFCRILADEFVLIVEESVQSIIFNRIDVLPETVLDILAHDLHVDWYDLDYPIAVKRNIIKDSVNVHRRLGTRYSVETALSNIYPGTEVAEWFEYGGDPFYFRVILDVTQQLASLTSSQIVRAINIYKSLRSHLEDEAIVYRSRVGIVIRTRSSYQKYAARQSGTYPHRHVIGYIGNEDIIIQTLGDAQGYINPHSGTIEVGTYPFRATMGGIGLEDILIESEFGDATYSLPRSGTEAVGTYPHRAVVGEVATEGIDIQTHADGAEYAARATGTYPGRSTVGRNIVAEIAVATDVEGAGYASRPAGTYPSIATVGETEGSELSVTAEGDAAIYNSRFCGTPHGSLIM